MDNSKNKFSKIIATGLLVALSCFNSGQAAGIFDFLNSLLKAETAQAATSGQLKLYFHKEPSSANETYNSLTFTPPEPSAYTSSALTSTANVNAAPPTSFCESTNNTGETYNQVGAAAATTGNRCIGTFISAPVGQSISLSTSDASAIAGAIWSSESNSSVTAAVNVYIYRWTGSGTTVTSTDRIATFTGADPGTGATLSSFAATAPANNITFAATDRIVAIVSMNVTGAASSRTVSVYFDNAAAATMANITLKYTAITPNKPALNGPNDDDFTTDSATTGCNTSGVAYNTKWTCLQGTAANTGGDFNAGGTGASPSGDTSDWLWLRNKITTTAGVPSNFGTTPSNTFLYQALDTGYGDGAVRTVVNSSLAYTIGATNPTTPFSHSGIVLWYSNTDYLEVEVYSDAAKGATNSTEIGLNNSGTLTATTSINSSLSNGLYNRVWVGINKSGNNYQAQYSTDGTTWINLGAAVSHATAFTRVGLNAFTQVANPISMYAGAFEWFQETFLPPPSLTVGATAGSQVATLNSGDISQYVNAANCSASSTCAAFTLTVASQPITLNSIKITEVGTVSAANDLSNAALFYDTDGNYSNGVTGQYGSTVGSFDGSQAANISGSLAMATGTIYYFYVRFDLKSGTPTYPAGGQVIDFQIVNTSDVTGSGSPVVSGTPILAGSTTVKPVVTGYSNLTESALDYAASCTNCGARIGPGSSYRQSVTISGYGFGTDPGLGSRNAATNKVEIIGTSTMALADDGSADTNVSAWSNTSITIRTDSSITGNADADWGTNFGGANALRVTASGTASNLLNFYIFPQVTTLTAPTAVADAAREYDPGDSDGVITLNGTRFGSSSSGGWVRILGCDAITCSSPSGSATTTAWSNTSITVQVPTVIANNAYAGSVVMQQGGGANGNQDTYTASGFRVLPRVSGFAPASGAIGDAVTVNGDHLCQNGGSCPGAFDANNKVTFNPGVDATTLTSWTDTAIQTAVPTGAASGLATTTSNTYVSNGKSFTLLSSTPNSPSNLSQFKNSVLTQLISLGSTASATPVYLTMTMQAPVSGGTLYPQVEYQPLGTGFSCGAGACGSAVEGTGVAGPGPIDCSQTGNNCSIAVSLPDDSYHWQARVRHRKNGIDYYSGWVSFGGPTDFIMHVAPPVISAIASSTTANTATVTWTTDELSTSRVQYNTTGTFVSDCSAFNNCTTFDPTNATNHSVNVTGLASTTVYYFRVRSIDIAGNEASSTNYAFKTGGASQVAITGDLTSVVFDTASSTGGPAYNSIMWQGVLGGAGQNQGKVRFQLAASDCYNGATNYPTCSVGSWSFIGGGTCGAADWYDPGGPGVPAEIGCYPAFNNKRYYRYKVQVCSNDCNINGTSTPRIDDIIVNYSP